MQDDIITVRFADFFVWFILKFQTKIKLSYRMTKPTKMACAPSEDSVPPSLMRAFTVLLIGS